MVKWLGWVQGFQCSASNTTWQAPMCTYVCVMRVVCVLCVLCGLCVRAEPVLGRVLDWGLELLQKQNTEGRDGGSRYPTVLVLTVTKTHMYHTYTRTHAHARAHAHMHTRIHARAHLQ